MSSFRMALFCVLMGQGCIAKADPTLTPSADFPRHFVASYALSLVSYEFFTKAVHWEPWQAYIFSAMLVGMAGMAFEASESNGRNDNLGKAMLYNGTGIMGAGLTILALEF